LQFRKKDIWQGVIDGAIIKTDKKPIKLS